MNPITQSLAVSQAMTDFRVEYEAMRESRHRRKRPGATAAGAGADLHYSNEALYTKCREYARAMVRDDEVIQFIIERAVTNVIRNGFQGYPDTGDKGLNKDIWSRFSIWATDPLKCDIEQNLSWMEMQQVAGFQFFMDGEVLSFGTEEGSLQFFEAHRLRNPKAKKPNIFHGIEMGEFRQRVAYHFTKEAINPNTGRFITEDGPRIEAVDGNGNQQVYHVYQPNRFSQSRGMTRLKAVYDLASRRSDIDFALMIKEQMTACLVWEESHTDPNSAPRPDVQMGARQAQARSDGGQDVLEEIGPGAIVRPPPGKKLAMHSPNIPSAETMQHLRMAMMILSLNLGVPLCVATMDPSEGNFSAYRAALDQAKLGWVVLQGIFEQRLVRPVHAFRTRKEIEDDKDLARFLGTKKAKRKINPFALKVMKPKWPYLQPLHDAQADSMRVERYLAGAEEVIAGTGGDPDDVIRETTNFNARAVLRSIKLSKKIEEMTGVKVHFRDVYNRSLPDGSKMTDSQDVNGDKEATTKQS